MTVLGSFTTHLPVRIRFGEHSLQALAEIVGGLDAGSVVAVLDEHLARGSAEVASALEPLDGGDRPLIRHLKQPGEPTFADVDAAAAVIAAADRPVIVAIGGGSAIDTGKAARVCVEQGCTCAELVAAPRAFAEPARPLIAAPTTAGTGSEVSGGAVITDERGRKSAIADPTFRAQHAIVDPVLTRSMPKEVTAHSGIDALSQAIAGMLVRCRTPIGDAIALEAIRLIGRALPRAYRDGHDREARAEMACGSLMGGLTMNIADCGAEHALAQALGGELKLPHGLTIGLVMTEVLEREAQHSAGQLERIADALGAPASAAADGSRAIAAIRGLLAELDFPILSEIEMTDDQLDRIVDAALGDDFLAQSPVGWDAAAVRTTFETARARRRQ